MIAALFRTLRTWFRKGEAPAKCLQCGLPPGREFLIATDEPIMHPHECSWCKSVLYVPGPMFSCKKCAVDVIQRPAA